MNGEPAAYPQRRTNYPEIGTPELRRQLGKELKSAREFQEMSLEQVMAITKISLRYLENIEEGRWSFLPPTYVKAFVRAYSSAVGLQTDKLSNRLDELFSHVVTAVAPVRPQFQYGEEAAPGREVKTRGFITWSEKHRAALFYIIVGTIAAALVAVYLSRPREPQQTGLGEAPDTVVKATAHPAPPPPALDTTTTAAPPVKSDSATTASQPGATISLQITVRDTCYVKIEHSDSVIYERILAPGEVVTLDAPHPIRLSLGNSPAVEIKVDGQQLPAFPSSRRVQVVKLGPGGIIN